MKNIVVLTGAGISAESGLKTFRDENGLWEGHDIYEVASPQGFEQNPTLVLDFYNQRRRQLLEVKPNAAHLALQQLEEKYNVHTITQNVDDLHERAGSKNVIHLHGELLKARSTANENSVIDWKEDIMLGDLCANQHQLRPHIVWFGEAVPMLPIAAEIVEKADILLIIGTSMQVYPAAGLVDFASRQCQIYFIDPKPAMQSNHQVKVIAEKATIGVPALVEELLSHE
ncbi:NAD-dependent deacylase [Mesonia sp. K7]|uniref:SIR2 family NAD-dependent protein deacylase n=1 Tax=Mesonia sp. K7 TaxID=2218606 RepID=UPI000DAA015F|nr:NAD-dependent deacylase [Mesonia sp. K7]PZD76906.1 NAD-dependent deacylase [Mesonia sp. K7]